MSVAQPLAVVADPLDKEAVAELSRHARVADATSGKEALERDLPSAQALLVRSRTKVDAAMISRGEKLTVIGRAGVGVDNIDVAAATKRGIPVVNAPAAATTSVAELVVGLLVAVARDLGSQVPSLKKGEWKKAGNGLELAGRTVGFIGYGRIAREAGNRLKAFGMKVQAYDPYLTKSPDGAPLLSLEELLAGSQVVSLHTPLTPETKNLLNAGNLSRLPKGAIVLNVARGGLVDEAALLAALESGHLAGAGLDVFEEEPPKNAQLLAHPKVVVTPHIGASTHEAQARAGSVTVEQVLKVLRGETPEYCVNPEARRT
ncbi:MAG: hydroxyacid dehydrogenase [Euryarchaeota archaeon]|nr:hydroxyacid dehydrogenase [Euryarchaeota archaeon]MDE1879949.1 hydroxyacid dehydrogenase [Euryarchaeota archaeon]